MYSKDVYFHFSGVEATFFFIPNEVRSIQIAFIGSKDDISATKLLAMDSIFNVVNLVRYYYGRFGFFFNGMSVIIFLDYLCAMCKIIARISNSIY